MPSRVWSHVCSFATIDHFGRVSIIEEIDTFYATQLPAMQPTLYVISKWEGYNGEAFTLQLRMGSPVAGQAGWPDYFRELPAQHFAIGQNYAHIAKVPHIEKYSFALVSMFTLTFTEFGDYPIEFLLDGGLVHVMPFHVLEWRS